MKKYNLIISLCLLLFLSNNLFSQQQKLAQTGFKFLSLSLDARANGFGDAVTSLEYNSAAMFYNPAGMARMNTFADVSIGQTQFIADIKYQYGSISFAPFDGDYGIIAFSFTSVDYGDFLGTVRYNNDQGFLDVGTFSPTAISFGIGYAKALSDKFSIGGAVKYARQSLGTSVVDGVVAGPEGYITGVTEENKLDILAFDFGVIYKTGYESLDIGMSVRNFSREAKYKEDGFQLPLIFQIGASFNAADVLKLDRDMHSILLSVDANHPRDYPEQVNVGIEYTFMKLLSLRGGYSAPNDERDFSYGVGLKHSFSGFNFGLDYAYAPFGVFDSVHRISLNFAY